MTPLIDELSPREEQVLMLLAQGYGNREIAAKLDISPWTVKNHKRSGREKLKAATTTQAAAIVFAARERAIA